MNNKKLTIKANIQILKPTSEVFEAIVDPNKMYNYFISESTGRMEAGKELVWRFPEFDLSFPIKVAKVEAHQFISFYWETDGVEDLVEITLTPFQENYTIVTVQEKERNADE